MVKKAGQSGQVYKRVTCKECGAILQYLPLEVKEHVYHDYSGGSDSYRYIECPECKNKVTVK